MTKAGLITFLEVLDILSWKNIWCQSVEFWIFSVKFQPQTDKQNSSFSTNDTKLFFRNNQAHGFPIIRKYLFKVFIAHVLFLNFGFSISPIRE